MATEEELRDVQIEKTKAEADLAREQLRELQRSSHFLRRIGQGVGVGGVLALAAMALFEPIKDTIEAESRLAALNARIADRTNADLQQRLEEREKQLEVQEGRYTKDLDQLAEELRNSNEARDAAIVQTEQLASQEKDLAEKYKLLAEQQQNNEELLAQAEAANSRAEELGAEIAKLRTEATKAAATVAQVQTRVDVRPLHTYKIAVGRNLTDGAAITERLGELGLDYSRFSFCAAMPERHVMYFAESDEEAARLLASALEEVAPDLSLSLLLTPSFSAIFNSVLHVC